MAAALWVGMAAAIDRTTPQPQVSHLQKPGQALSKASTKATTKAPTKAPNQAPAEAPGAAPSRAHHGATPWWQDALQAHALSFEPVPGIGRHADQPPAAEPETSPDLSREIHCLALNIYLEARSEPEVGKRAVAAVTLNRVADPKFPKTVCQVVHQGGSDGVAGCQFSWVCDGRSDRPYDHVAWRNAKQIAETALLAKPSDPTRGALWYHADYVRPAWSRAKQPVAKIGRHIYYRQS
jgi:spore germination cell wall hydrolase CwlJ-like protein